MLETEREMTDAYRQGYADRINETINITTHDVDKQYQLGFFDACSDLNEFNTMHGIVNQTYFDTN